MRHWAALAVVLAVMIAGGIGIRGQRARAGAAPETQPAGPAEGAVVVLKGSLVCNGACIPAPKADEHMLVLYALDGTPEVRAEVEKIMKEGYPARGLDADAAEKLMDQFTARLKFYLAPDSPALRGDKNRGPGHYCMPAKSSAVTGVVAEKDGKRWISATKIEPTTLKYPEAMMAPDQPMVMPAKDALVLKIGDKLALKCVWVPPGKFLMGTPLYMWPYYVEEYPHCVTLTKGFYLAEVPVTQEVYAAVMDGAAPAAKDGQLPVKDPKFADLTRFCMALGGKSGRKVRLPTDAEWEYAARVGTSSPGFAEKYKDQNSSGANGSKTPLAVKSMKPNAWGLYDMASCWWEITADRGMYNVRQAEVDPRYPPASDSAKIQRSGRGIVSNVWSIGTHEFIGETGYAGQKFRFVVEMEAAATKPGR